MTRSKIRTSGAEGLTLSSTALTVANGLTLTDGDIAFADGHGLNFASASGDASGMASELLDDYEEGTWTPGLTLGGTACTVTSEGNYTKVGRVVTVNMYIAVTNTNSGSGTAHVTSFPFAVADLMSNTSVEANGSVSLWNSFATGMSFVSLFAQTSQQGELQGLSSSTGTASIPLTNTHIDSSCDFRASVTYFTT